MKTTDNGGRHVKLVNEEQLARLGHYFRSYLGDTPEADECVRETLARLAAVVRGLRGGQREFIAGISMRIAYLLCEERQKEMRWRGGGRQTARYEAGRLES